MNPYITVYTGGNTVDLRKALKNLRAKAQSEQATILEYTITSPEDLSDVLSELQSDGFFGAEQRVFLLFGLPPTVNAFQKADLEVLEGLWSSLSPLAREGSSVVCVSPQPDKRLRISKTILKAGNLVEFPSFPLYRGKRDQRTDSAAAQWITPLLPPAAQKLAGQIVSRVGVDPERLVREAHKVSLWIAEKKTLLTTEELDQILIIQEQAQDFLMSSAIQTGSSARVQEALQALVSQGEIPSVLLVREVLPVMRQLSLVFHSQTKGFSAESFGLHPYVVQKLSRPDLSSVLERSGSVLDALLHVETQRRSSLLGSGTEQEERLLLEIARLLSDLMSPSVQASP